MSSTESMGTQAASLPSDSALRLVHLDFLRGLGIIVVVGIHAFGYAGSPDVFEHSTAESIWAAIASFAVPSFFLCDGYLFALSLERSPHRGFALILARSARRLLWPWLVFTVLYTLARAAGELAGVFQVHLVLGRGPAELEREWWFSQIAMQLYFLPALFLIRCLGPVLRPLAIGPAWPSVIAMVAWIALRNALGIPLGSDPVTQALSGLRFYLIGIVAYRYRGPILAHAGPILVMSAVVMLASVLPHRWPGAMLFYQLAFLVGAHVATRLLDPQAGVIAFIGRQTMGIYLLHAPPVMKAAQLFVDRFAPPWTVRFVAIWSVSFLIALGLTTILQKRACGRAVLGHS